jgi:UDPglucose 6-dehydrogenase
LKIQVIGLGTVGSATAYMLYKLGHDVYGYDKLPKKVGYYILVDKPITDADLTFICVGEKDVEDVVKMLVDNGVKGPYIIRGTVKPETTERLMREYMVHIIHNPEFLREKHAFEDVMNPSRIIIGQCCDEHGNMLANVYKPLGRPIYFTTPTNSEMIKLTINLLRVNAITFWNEIYMATQALSPSLDIKWISEVVDQERTLGEYEGGEWGVKYFGRKFGGKCFPENIDQIIEYFKSKGLDPRFWETVREVNEFFPAED